MNGKWGLTRGNLLGGREKFPRIEKCTWKDPVIFRRPPIEGFQRLGQGRK